MVTREDKLRTKVRRAQTFAFYNFWFHARQLRSLKKSWSEAPNPLNSRCDPSFNIILERSFTIRWNHYECCEIITLERVLFYPGITYIPPKSVINLVETCVKYETVSLVTFNLSVSGHVSVFRPIPTPSHSRWNLQWPDCSMGHEGRKTDAYPTLTLICLRSHGKS